MLPPTNQNRANGWVDTAPNSATATLDLMAAASCAAHRRRGEQPVPVVERIEEDARKVWSGAVIPQPVEIKG